jgi:PAS domain S-box-containing protein
MGRRAAVLARIRKGRPTLALLYVLACAAVVTGWISAESRLRPEFLASVGLAAAAVLLGWSLDRKLKHRDKRMLALAAIVETTGDAVIAARLDRTITTWNAGAERLFGYTAEEMIGGSVAQLAVPGEENSAQEHLEHMLENDGMHAYEVERMHKSGELIDVAITLSPLRDDDGRVVGVSSILRDVSDRKKLEAERERLLARERNARADAEYARALVEEQNAHLVELDRMKDDFVASVSHELRTPLTSIDGYLDLLVEDSDNLTQEQRKFVTVVQRNCERLTRLVGDLLFVAQVDAGRISLKPVSLDLVALVSDSVEVTRPAAEAKEITLRLEADQMDAIDADSARLGQAFDNLLSNAIKFTPPGGSVVVRAFKKGADAVIEVVDTGMGIAPTDQQRLFDRFFRAAAVGELAIPGTGLGLSITKAIIEGHGGSISVASQPGEGTTVRIQLPARAARTGSPEPAEAAA